MENLFYCRTRLFGRRPKLWNCQQFFLLSTRASGLGSVIWGRVKDALVCLSRKDETWNNSASAFGNKKNLWDYIVPAERVW